MTIRTGIQTIEMFTSCIYAQRFNNNYRRAETLLEELRLKSISPMKERISGRKKKTALRLTISPFNALLAVYDSCVSRCALVPTENGDYINNFTLRKRKVLDDIKELNLTWDPYTYTTAFMNEKNKTAVLDLWHKFKADKHNYIPSYVQVIKVLHACVYHKDGNTSLEVLRYLWDKLDDTSSLTKSMDATAAMQTKGACQQHTHVHSFRSNAYYHFADAFIYMCMYK